MLRGIYPGSFDPVTFGHVDVITRSAGKVDELIVGVLNNKAKSPLFSVEERVNMLKEVTRHLKHVTIQSFDGLLVEFAVQSQANMIVRGLRAITDFEYELQMALINARLNPRLETMFIPSSAKYTYISSSVVKELASYGADLTDFVPREIIGDINEKINRRDL